MPTILHIAVFSTWVTHFDYLLPEGYTGELPPIGVRVKVPFGKRERIGILIGVAQQSKVPAHKLKPILALLDQTPLLPPSLFKLLQKASLYYHYPLGDVFKNALPKLIREGGSIDLSQVFYQLATDRFSPSPSKVQSELIEILKAHPNGLSHLAIQALGFKTTTVEALEKKSWIKPVKQTLNSFTLPTLKTLTLNKEQQLAVDTINACQGFQTILLEGVTGSGKTEVYLQAIEKTLRSGHQALVLIPEIGLTPQTLERFQQRFPVSIAVFHSKITDQEKYRAWISAYSGEALIVIGTRSSLFVPLKNPGLIIIDEEHDASFKQQSGFRYSARDLAILRAQLENLPIVLGSATPSLETLWKVKQKRYHHLALTQRANLAKPPTLFLIDLRKQTLKANMTAALLQSMEKHLARGNQVLVFLNRRGFCPVLLCHQCGWVANCKQCDAKMTLHHTPHRLFCHHCGYNLPKPSHCEACQHTELLSIGFGTERIEHFLKKYFPSFPVLRIDRDSLRKKNSMQTLFKQINQGMPQILVGTQMLAKGHHFPNITMVAILDGDSSLYSADFRATERMGQLITQVSGRAGRSEKEGEVYIQTHHPEHPLLQILMQQGYHAFAEQLIEERQTAKLPPFHHLAIIRAEAKKAVDAFSFLQQVRLQLITLNIKQLEIYPPMPALMERKLNRYRAMLLLNAKNRSDLHLALKNFSLDNSNSKVSYSLEIDPLEVL